MFLPLALESYKFKAVPVCLGIFATGLESYNSKLFLFFLGVFATGPLLLATGPDPTELHAKKEGLMDNQ